MLNNFTLLYWMENGWYIGQLKEMPSVFSQAETLDDLKDNIQDAYSLMIETADLPLHGYRSMSIQIETV